MSQNTYATLANIGYNRPLPFIMPTYSVDDSDNKFILEKRFPGEHERREFAVEDMKKHIKDRPIYLYEHSMSIEAQKKHWLKPIFPDAKYYFIHNMTDYAKY